MNKHPVVAERFIAESRLCAINRSATTGCLLKYRSLIHDEHGWWIERQHSGGGHQRRVQAIKELHARILYELLLIEDPVIIDLLARSTKAVYACDYLHAWLEMDLLPIGEH